MKVGKLEGSPQEIHDFFVITKSDVSKYIESPGKISRIYFIVAIVLLLLSFFFLVFSIFPPVFFIIGLACVSFLSVCVQIRYENKFATCCTAFFGFTVLLIALGALSPMRLYQSIIDRFHL